MAEAVIGVAEQFRGLNLSMSLRRGPKVASDQASKQEWNEALLSSIRSNSAAFAEYMDRHNRDMDRIWRCCLFASLRFARDDDPEAGCQEEAEALRDALKPEGVLLQIVNARLGENIRSRVQATMQRCSYFVAFGCADYGEVTPTVGNTSEEVNFWQNGVRARQSEERNIIPINMLRPGEQHSHATAHWIFGQGFMTLFWRKRTPVPGTAVRDILQRIGLEPVSAQQQQQRRRRRRSWSWCWDLG
eukprot:CAMPEP_0119000368 /NCGR_PEP_ID=MMETSP1173-20130426/64044_1 /TAXON_ID=1034831 /ORGANISM="Rhizochromulina marina cf, Strain CCMP1243" /LENGTH=244 /DNA_ID=CAMNT_0006951871 /DNA_START=6 /DNA_END=740 /DNA_ORIENTATION=+